MPRGNLVMVLVLALMGGGADAAGGTALQGRAQTQEVHINSLLIQGSVRHYE